MSIKKMVYISLIVALMAATAGVSIPMGGIIPPITLQTFFVLLAGLILGPKYGALSMIIYVLMGALGIPVFSKFTSGFGILFGPTGGYIFAFIIGAYIVGLLRKKMNLYILTISVSLLILFIGSMWLMVYLKMSPITALLAGATPFIIGEILKSIIAVIIAKRLKLN